MILIFLGKNKKKLKQHMKKIMLNKKIKIGKAYIKQCDIMQLIYDYSFYFFFKFVYYTFLTHLSYHINQFMFRYGLYIYQNIIFYYVKKLNMNSASQKLKNANLHFYKSNKENQDLMKYRAQTFKIPKKNNRNNDFQSAEKQRLQNKQKKIMHCQSFLDDSVIINLSPSHILREIPSLDQMPSLQLNSTKSIILSPRGFDDFLLQVRVFQEKTKRNLNSRKLIKPVKQKIQSIIHINWKEHQNHYKTQVVRNNSSKAYYEKFKSYCEQKKQKYTDGVFLPNLSSFTNTMKNMKLRQEISNCIWKRIEGQQNSINLYDDPIQGIYKTSKLISCFLALPLKNKLYLFQDQKLQTSTIFYVKLNKEGFWRYIALDNIFPFTNNGISILTQGFIMSLLEKAWAKYMGCYQKLDSIQQLRQAQIITDLTGAPSQELLCTHPKIGLVLKNFLSQKYIVITSVSKHMEKRLKIESILGISSQYSYPIVAVEEDYVILKNQWGCKEDSVFLGQQNIKIKLSEMKNYFDNLVINKIIEDPFYNTLAVRQKKGFYSLIEMKPTKKTKAFIILSQIDKLNNFQEYSKCKLILFQSNEERIIHHKEIQSDNKQTSMEVQLLETTYLILVQIKWVAKQYETILSVMSSDEVELTKLKYNQENDYLLNLKKAKTKSERKMVIQQKKFQYQLGGNKSVRSAKNK